MNTKLTLSIEEEIIIKAKVFAKENGKSLSQLIENYLSVLVNDSAQIVEEEICSIEDVDRGAKVGLRWAEGPFEIANKTFPFGRIPIPLRMFKFLDPFMNFECFFPSTTNIGPDWVA